MSPEEIRKKFQEPSVAGYRKVGAFSADWIEKAFLKIPRHLFIRRLPASDSGYRLLDRHHHTDADLQTIYGDTAIMIHDPPSSSSQPWLMARMLGELDVKPGMRVLEIGTGSGYNAGLLSVGTGAPDRVYSIDIQPDLIDEAREHLHDAGADGVHLRAGDGAEGWPEAAPFDRIIGTAGCPDIAPAWMDQLAEGGILVLPFSIPGCRDPILRLTKNGGSLAGRFVVPSSFMGLQGALRSEVPFVLKSPAAIPQGTVRRILRLPHLDPTDLAFFLRSSPWCRPGGEQWLEHPDRSRLFDSRGRWTCDYDFDRETLTLSGRSEAVWNLGSLTERWSALGRPKISDFRVEISDSDPDPSSPADWIDARPNVRLRIFLSR